MAYHCLFRIAPSSAFSANSVNFSNTDKTIAVTFNPPSVLNRNGRIIRYNIYYSRQKTNNEYNVGPEMNLTVLILQQEASVVVNVSSLDEFSIYTFFIEACNAEGCSKRLMAGNRTTDESSKWKVPRR